MPGRDMLVTFRIGNGCRDIAPQKLVSPRVGFNWDLTGERKYILRGGTGYFVGRLPFCLLYTSITAENPDLLPVGGGNLN